MFILTNDYAGESSFTHNFAQAICWEYSGAMSETVKLSTLIPDGRNSNLGTPRGNQMIEDSLRQYGAGRSILLDKHGNIVAGNKTVENAAAIGMDDVIVVQSQVKGCISIGAAMRRRTNPTHPLQLTVE